MIPNIKYIYNIHDKNNFAEVSKNLLDTDLKIILLNHQSNYVERSNIFDNTAKCFNILATSLNVLIIILI